MHFLLVLRSYDDEEAVLDVRHLVILAHKHGHHSTLLTHEKKPPTGLHHTLKIVTCPSIGIGLWDDWRFQRTFRNAMASGKYDVSLSFSPVEGADFYVPRRFRIRHDLDLLLRRPLRLWQLCNAQIRSYFMYVTTSQGLSLQTMGGVPRARLIQVDPEFHEICLPVQDPAVRSELRRQLLLKEKHFCIIQVADDWYRQGVDTSLAVLATLPKVLRAFCRFVLIGRQTSQEKLVNLADRCGFPPTNVTNLGTSRTLAELLPAADLLLHPAREEEAGTMLLDAMTAGVPVVYTDNCGYSIFLHKTCCPVIPAPHHTEAIADALAFTILHLKTFRKLVPTEYARLGLQNRHTQLLHALETKPRLNTVPLEDAAIREIVKLHQTNLDIATDVLLKNEPKRATSRVCFENKRYLVKEFKRRPWWHLKRPYKRSLQGTSLLALYTPQVCGVFHNSRNGSDYLIFPDCGNGNFYGNEYALRDDAPQLYAACGRILAELHDAGIFHHDAKPANFVYNEFCKKECPQEVCLVDCDNVTRSTPPLPIPQRIHNLAQFIAGTGNLARQDHALWRKLVDSFCAGYTNHVNLPQGDLDQLWQRVWRTIESQSHIEYTLPDDCLEESTQIN
ncbi:MAG: glycosyltransferase family 4 protein [Victivallales bacterium]|nr:glycosyltransferase family 4 protein [Victivallales bacterium]